MNSKSCSRCQQVKPLSDFHKQSANPSGRAAYCKACVSNYGRSRYVRKMPLRTRDGKTQCVVCLEYLPPQEFASRQRRCRQCVRLARHNITRKEWDVLLAKQNGVCAICSGDEKLHVDHNHLCCPGANSCGNCIRGLLCQNCNTGIGLLGDSLDNLRAAITYLT